MGELIVCFTGVSIPSSIIGMLLLTMTLNAGIVKEHWVDKLSDFLVRNLGFFFVPAGISYDSYADSCKYIDFWLKPAMGGIPALTASVVICTGIFGGIAGFRMAKISHIKSPIASGLSAQRRMP